MKKFEEPKITVIMFASSEVITTSFVEPNKEGYTNNNDEYVGILDYLDSI